MKTPDISGLQESIHAIRQSAADLIDRGYTRLASYMLNPQSLADFTGMKKLIEKDYTEPQEKIEGSLVSS